MRSLLLVFVAMLAACSSNETTSNASQPIIGGTTDSGDPSVVLLGGGGVWCTGTLVAPNVVLTAAHCISAKNNFIYLGPQYLGDAGGATITVVKSYQHPDYATNKDVDIGIVVLSSAFAVTPSALSTAAPTVNANVHVVGFGNTANPTEPEFTKMQVDVPISAVASDSFDTGPAICSGDSGGPAFLTVNNEPVIAGVVSGHSIQACGGTAGYVRVDLYAQWIQQQVADAQVDAGAPPNDASTSDSSASNEAGEGGGTTGGPEPNDTAPSGGCAIGGASDGKGLAALVLIGWIVRKRRGASSLRRERADLARAERA